MDEVDCVAVLAWDAVAATGVVTELIDMGLSREEGSRAARWAFGPLLQRNCRPKLAAPVASDYVRTPPS
ncbi:MULTISPECIES: hypothetical protein [unclassified Bradyrhizobium]|uniref:hypothetical protein n=1 Tax=unclassified Bradyrhizobium TaxID=2631580 RepID=UPI00291612F1|nr:MULTISPECIES: hypothetical protein [unclassified Bradyrhizobium]